MDAKRAANVNTQRHTHTQEQRPPRRSKRANFHSFLPCGAWRCLMAVHSIHYVLALCLFAVVTFDVVVAPRSPFFLLLFSALLKGTLRSFVRSFVGRVISAPYLEGRHTAAT